MIFYLNFASMKKRRNSGVSGGKITNGRTLVTGNMQFPARLEDAYSELYPRVQFDPSWTPYKDYRFPRVEAIGRAWLPGASVVRRTPDPAYYGLLDVSVRLRNGFVTPVRAFMNWKDQAATAYPVVVLMAMNLSDASPAWSLTESSFVAFNKYWDDYIDGSDSSPDPMPSDVPRQWQYKSFFRPQVAGVADGELVAFKFGIFADLDSYILTDFNSRAKNLAVMVG